MFFSQLLCLSLLINVYSFIPRINQGIISRTSTTTSLIVLQAVNKRGRAQNKIIELGPSNPNESNGVKTLREKLKSEIEKSTTEFETGNELRKSRERDLKLAKIELDQQQYIYSVPDGGTERKWPIERVDSVINCLNLLYKHKMTKGSLTEAERAGLFDWNDFDNLIEEAGVLSHLVIDATTSLERELEKVHKWVSYHRIKGDISFNVDERLVLAEDDNNDNNDYDTAGDDGDLEDIMNLDVRKDVFEWTPRRKYRRREPSRKHPKKLNPKARKRRLKK